MELHAFSSSRIWYSGLGHRSVGKVLSMQAQGPKLSPWDPVKSWMLWYLSISSALEADELETRGTPVLAGQPI